MSKGILTINGLGNFKLRDIISSLQEVESAYNHIITFERVVDQLKVQLAIERPRPFEQPQFFRKP